MGEFHEQVYLDLIEKYNVPIQSITYFFPQDWIKKIQYIRCYQHISLLRNALQTKNVRIHAEFFPVLSECMAGRDATNINNHLSYFLFGNEILRNRNYQVFLKNFKEVDVELKGPCAPLVYEFEYRKYLTVYLNVFTFYDYLANKITESLPHTDSKKHYSHRRSTSKRHSIVLFRESILSRPSNISAPEKDIESYDVIHANVGATVIEAANTLKARLINNDELSCDVSEIEKLFIRKISQDIEACPRKRGAMKIAPDTQCFYFEPLTLFSLAQQLKTVFEEFRFERAYPYGRNWQLVVFKKRINFLNHLEKKFHLNTRVCFRDFAEFVFSRNPVLIEEPLVKDPFKKRPTADLVNQLGYISFNEFIRPRSLKYHKQLTQNPDVISNENHKHIRISEPYIEAHHTIEGYNLGDTHVQITENLTQFCSSNGSIKLMLNSWLYKYKEMEAQINVLNNQVLFNRTFDDKKRISIKIITFNKVLVCVEFIERKPIVSILWPNGRLIRNLNIKNESKLRFVELKHKKQYSLEDKRIYLSDGSMISFLMDRKAAILYRFNGTIIKTPVSILECKDYDEEVEVESAGEECEGECSEREIYKFELEWMKKVGDLFGLDGNSFLLRTHMDKSFHVHCGQITEKNHSNFFNYVRDYLKNNIVFFGEQRLTLAWSPEEMTSTYKIVICSEKDSCVTIKSKIESMEPVVDTDICEYCVFI